MDALLPKLLEMNQSGVDEAIQYIFDAMVEAERCGILYLNVYGYEAAEPGFLFTSDEQQARDQFARSLRTGKECLAFKKDGGTWQERSA
jgi:hypothetical protein